MLDSPDLRRCQLARQIRVLGKILKIPTAERISLDVQSRSQQYLDILLPAFLTQSISDFA